MGGYRHQSITKELSAGSSFPRAAGFSSIKFASRLVGPVRQQGLNNSQIHSFQEQLPESMQMSFYVAVEQAVHKPGTR